MDFSRSSTQQAPAARVSNAPAANGGHNNNKKNSNWRNSPMWLRVVWLILLFSGTLLAVAVVMLLYIGGPRESKLVDKTKFQAVFLTNQQVYFGNVVDITDEYLELKNIYYLSVNQQVQPEQEGQQQQNITLQKLGCELHGPVDQMVVNREQITFWENLKTDGQVSKAIDQWVEQNPDGLKCQEPANNTDTTGNTNNNEENEQ